MGENKIVVKNKRATNAGTETLCGSIASLAECVQNMRQALLDGETKREGEIHRDEFIVESIEAATLHPATGKFLFWFLSIALHCLFFSSWNRKTKGNISIWC